jgi:hypothetical protein
MSFVNSFKIITALSVSDTIYLSSMSPEVLFVPKNSWTKFCERGLFLCYFLGVSITFLFFNEVESVVCILS